MNSNGVGSQDMISILSHFRLRRGIVFGGLIIAALLAFEVFNYSTTEFALKDLLGDLRFAGIRWATILAIAFCGIDFAGIARLFTPEEGANEPNEVWYLFGAWMLAATMNAMLTWWGVSMAVVNNTALGSSVVDREILTRAVPIFVAILVWLIRVLIIGTFSVAGDRLFSEADLSLRASQARADRRISQPRTADAQTVVPGRARTLHNTQTRPEGGMNRPLPAASPSFSAAKNRGPEQRRPARALNNRPQLVGEDEVDRDYDEDSQTYTRQEPTYHPAKFDSYRDSGRGSNEANRR